MRPEARSMRWVVLADDVRRDPDADVETGAGTSDPGYGPLDAELVSLDATLAAAGAHARLALRRQTEPTRWFSGELRKRLLSSR